ncbi:uracil-DNA glycosylase [Natrialbaceae archaeon A-gly3]
MDEECRNCPALCETRTEVVHGYGDVGADFLFVLEAPSQGTDEAGIPLEDDESGTALRRILEGLALCDATSDPDRPELHNTYVTHLTRCHDPDREPTDEEIGNCEPYLNAEIRMINPEVIVPVGERSLQEIGEEYTTTPVEELDCEVHHGESIRGRGFELVPMLDPLEQSDDERRAWLEAFAQLMATDYRQTKGRQER